MTAGPLHPDNLTAGKDRSLGKGHGVGALGPSDTSDSGSDLRGAPGLDDAEMDSDSDSSGTGERAAAERDTVVSDGADIDTDHVEMLPPDIDPEGEDDRKSR